MIGKTKFRQLYNRAGIGRGGGLLATPLIVAEWYGALMLAQHSVSAGRSTRAAASPLQQLRTLSELSALQVSANHYIIVIIGKINFWL
jgi:hypothetical protein